MLLTVKCKDIASADPLICSRLLSGLENNSEIDIKEQGINLKKGRIAMNTEFRSSGGKKVS